MKIIIADDHALFREALAHYIERSESDAEVILTQDFHGVMEFLLHDPGIDLVMLDLRMPGMNGLQGLQKLRAAYPQLPIVLLSGLAQDEDVKRALDLGARGYFPKTLPGKIMLQGIYKILQGEKFIPMDHNTNEMMPSYFTDSGAPMVAADHVHLTPREKQVLTFLSRGVSNKEIAQALDLQVVTIKLHVRGICRKLGVKNRTQAALRAQSLVT
ncbi:MAG: response regulator [Micavibrio sp.]|nr:response regulator [Micavibrio sp.]